jgi:hypothetical protein
MTSYVERELRANTAREYRRILQGQDTKEWASRPITSIAKQDGTQPLPRRRDV